MLPGFVYDRKEAFLTITPTQEPTLTAFVHAAHVLDVLTQPDVHKPPVSDILKLKPRSQPFLLHYLVPHGVFPLHGVLQWERFAFVLRLYIVFLSKQLP